MRAPTFIAFVVACSSLALSCSKEEKHPVLRAEPNVAASAIEAQPQPEPSEPAPAAAKALPSPPEPKPTAAVEASPKGVCAFDEPQFFGGLPAKWEGGCEDGKANGRGVLRSLNGKKVAATFYGVMDRGNPKLGVVEDRDGLIIGRFAPGGKPIESDEFKDRLDGVNEAVAAATQINESYERAGNTASAAFYGKKVKMLNKQIE
jgi:hypothetical protein